LCKCLKLLLCGTSDPFNRRHCLTKLRKRLAFDLQYFDKEWSIKAGIAKGRPLPEWINDEPPRLPNENFYLRAFNDLTTCRDVGTSIGPIPWRDIFVYAGFKGLEHDLIDPFIQIIREMDSAYLDYQRDKQADKPEDGTKARA